MTIIARPSEWTWPRSDTSQGASREQRHQLYFAFISYSHADEAAASWLHESLERFRVPKFLVGKLTEQGAIPARLSPIFRDLKELPAAGDLGNEIRTALVNSRCLIVLCSPTAATSKWTNREIEAFRLAHPDGCLLAAVLSGKPFASEIEGEEAEECLPPALRVAYDKRGRPMKKRAEPLCADLRGGSEDRRLGFLKLVAGMLGIGLDDLVQRDTIRRHRRMAAVAGGSMLGTLVAIGLAVTAIQAGDEAQQQRQEAESLVGFMLGDLRDKLEPLGRLDVLDSVGVRALEYYGGQDPADLSDDSLAQRSKALTLMGEIAQTRGDLATAFRHYRQAFAGSAEALRRDPGNAERLFEHAQNVFWIGYIYWQRGDLPSAESAFRTYKRLAERMIAIDALQPRWRLERKYADVNLGVLLMDQRRFEDAADAFQSSLETVEALAAADPANGEYQKALIEGLGWLADARQGAGQIDIALAHRERQVGLLDNLRATFPTDREYVRKSLTAHSRIGALQLARGNPAVALAEGRKALADSAILIRTEPGNSEWLSASSVAQFQLAAIAQAADSPAEAAAAARAGCMNVDRLMAKAGSARNWSEGLRLECLEARGRLALAQGTPNEAEQLARQAMAIAGRAKGRTPVDVAVYRATARQLLGDSLAAAGRSDEARREWRAAAAHWPDDSYLEPHELAQKAKSLRLAGDRVSASGLAARLRAIGYRGPPGSGI